MNDATIRELLHTAKSIAVVGLSSNPWRASFGVSKYMHAQGYRIIPVNPNEVKVLGEQAFPSLAAVPGGVDIVNIFRRSEFIPEIVDAAIAKGARCVWMQQGIIHTEAAGKAEKAGLLIVMDRCIGMEHRRLLR
jgi:predicted CoA-binding protein